MEEQIDILQHDGVAHDENPPGRGSGRWPWGSGDKPFQRPKDFLQQIERLKAMGLSQKDQAASVGLFTRDRRRQFEGSPSRLLTAIRIAKHEEKLDLIRECKRLSREEHLTPTQIAKKLGIPNESSVRGYLKEDSETKAASAQILANDLKKIVDSKNKPVNVGEGVSYQLNVTEDRFKEALEILYFDGYEIHNGRVPQPNNPKHQTTIKVLCPPGTPPKAAYDYDNIFEIQEHYISHDGKKLENDFQYPASLDSKRLMIRYAEDGGVLKDGVVELRPGVKDIDLDGSHYSQVRILVDGTHYIKGMAVYGDPKDFPKGVDLIFNTNKSVGTPVMDSNPDAKQVLKPIGPDPNNPFNSAIKEHGGQHYWTDDDGEQHLSLINKREDEGGWDDWSKRLPSQFLSKQPRKFVETQLNVSKKEARAELDKIKTITNDNVKGILLDSYASSIDGQATKLYASSVPGQRYQVLLPVNSLKDDEIYAPNFNDGETVSLIRFPHAGQFEIPTLKVNNKNAEGNRVITKDAKDAVGINHRNFQILSGADADGDTVLVIPHRNGLEVASKRPLRELIGFDPELEYGNHEGNRLMKKGHEQQMQMGIVSNLITDMQLSEGCSDHDLAMAVKHSMIVIDAVKHKYDWKQSEKDNHIEELKKKYQPNNDPNRKKPYGGAGTIISRAKSKVNVQGIIKEGERRIDPVTGKSRTYYIDPETGEKLTTIVDKPYHFYMMPNERDANGKKMSEKDRRMYPMKSQPGMYRNQDSTVVLPKEALVLSSEQHDHDKTTRMEQTRDAFTLVSQARNPVELAYAEYANYLKALANEARKETYNLHPTKYDPLAAKTYASEVKSLNDKYKDLEVRKPLENAANREADTMIKGWYEDNPGATSEQKGKAKQRILTYCRKKRGLTGASSTIEITPKEWEAIQAGAISSKRLNTLLRKANMDVIREYAMPKQNGKLSQAQISRIKAMAANPNISNAQIAEALNINVSTVINYLKGDE